MHNTRLQSWVRKRKQQIDCNREALQGYRKPERLSEHHILTTLIFQPQSYYFIIEAFHHGQTAGWNPYMVAKTSVKGRKKKVAALIQCQISPENIEGFGSASKKEGILSALTSSTICRLQKEVKKRKKKERRNVHLIFRHILDLKWRKCNIRDPYIFEGPQCFTFEPVICLRDRGTDGEWGETTEVSQNSWLWPRNL